MYWQLIILLLVVAAATVVVYVALGLILPKRWRKNEVEESEDFAINSVNVLIKGRARVHVVQPSSAGPSWSRCSLCSSSRTRPAACCSPW